METQILKISEIKLNPNNPRLIKDDKFEKLVNSIKEFPQMLKIRPIVVNSDMVILGGNMRFKACKEAGLKEIPVIVANELTEDQQREFLIKDNVSGGDLHVPDYGATIGQEDNSILVYPAWRNVHAVTPIIPTHKDGYRNSLVFYPLKAFKGLK
jgi:ParB-like chromosome segregation protein Spo0J